MKSNIQMSSDPYHIIITGVGGQGNVMASRVLGNMLFLKGLFVTIGETFGMNQRGGSVMSHLTVSSTSTQSPQIPKGKAQIVMALEPIEAIRVLADFGNLKTKVLCNTRPIHPVAVISGEVGYPSRGDIENWVTELSGEAWFINATDEAIKLGKPVLANTILMGALSCLSALPLDRESFENVISRNMPPEGVQENLLAYDTGVSLLT